MEKNQYFLATPRFLPTVCALQETHLRETPMPAHIHAPTPAPAAPTHLAFLKKAMSVLARPALLLVVTMALLLISGCTAIARIKASENTDEPKPPYPGVSANIASLRRLTENRSRGWFELPGYVILPVCIVSLPIDIAVDTIFLPYDIPSFIYYSSVSQKIKKLKRERDAEEERLAELIQKNPNIIVEEQWSKKSTLHKNVIRKTFYGNHPIEFANLGVHRNFARETITSVGIPYTDEQLEEIFKISEIREVFLEARECGEDFILRHLDEITSFQSKMLFKRIIENPNATVKLFKKITSLRQNTGVAAELIPRVTLGINEPILLMTSAKENAERVVANISSKRLLREKMAYQFIGAKDKKDLNALLRNEPIQAGRQRDNQQWLRDADGGILFVGKLETLDHAEQAALLRLVREKVFSVIGMDKEIRVDCQLIGEATEDLSQLVREGKFSAELLACFEGRVFYLDSWWDFHHE